MAAPLSALSPQHHMRPVLQRTRSASSPSQNDAAPSTGKDGLRPARPQHVRSHSLRTPGAILPQDVSKVPASNVDKLERSSTEKSHRIHLPGKHHLHHSRGESQDSRGSTERRRSKIHRYTQSLAQSHHYTNNHAYHNAAAALHSSHLRSHHPDDSPQTDSLPNLFAGLNAERQRAALQRTSPTDTLNLPHPPNTLSRVPTAHSYRGLAAADPTHHLGYSSFYDSHGRPTDALRRRATSDPRSPSYDPQSLTGAAAGTAAKCPPKSQIEQDLERAFRLKQQRKFTLTNADVRTRDKEIAAAEEELRGTLQDVTQRGMEITRRLDYGYYSLLEKVGNLAGVIQSFQSLSTQSGQLIENLEGEVDKTDRHVREKAGALRVGFREREARVGLLEERGREVQRKAEEMGRRLERAREKIQKWEESQVTRRKVWGRFVVRMWGMAGGLFALVVALVVAKQVWLGVQTGGTDGLVVPNLPGVGTIAADGLLNNGSLPVVGGLRGLEAAKQRVPDDVKEVLVEIEERNREGYGASDAAVRSGDGEAAGSNGGAANEHAVLRALDEL